jgi:hypothetical protein
MSTPASVPANDVPPLFEALVDDAALFPPGNAPMPDAVTGHLSRRRGPWRHLVGRFLCAASRLPELRAALDGRVPAGEALTLGIVVDTGLDGLGEALRQVAEEPRLALALVEIPLPRDLSGPALRSAAEATVQALPDLEAYVELPRNDGWRDALAVVADTAYGAKLRTGGLSAELFPTEGEVAAFVEACVAAETPFKCTAGLHHAVRHTDPATGFEHHGFLNILLATHAATQGESDATVTGLLAERDGAALAARAATLDPTEAVVARSFFVAYGSCSIDEPVDDLTALALLTKE